MNLIRNERGGALLIVFFILILFTILGFALANQTMHSVKQRAFAEDEVQGKLLAEAGLDYFKEYLESHLGKTRFDSLDDPNPASGYTEDEVIRLIEAIAATDNDPAQDRFQRIDLPGLEGHFALHYRVANRIPREEGSLSQPYVLKVEVSALGIPQRAENLRQVRLDATVYINTIPAPFHYVISTPGELRLFGGSNMIGNIAARSIIKSEGYRFSEWVVDDEANGTGHTEWQAVRMDDPKNQSYIEGEIFLPESGTIIAIDAPSDPDDESESMTGDAISLPAGLEEHFTPRDFEDLSDEQRDELFDENTSSLRLSADPDTPYLPGLEAPTLSRLSQPITGLFADESGVADLVRAQLVGKEATSGFQQNGYAFQFEALDNPDLNEGFESKSPPDRGDSLVIRSSYDTIPPSFVNLTVRLTGTALADTEISTLYIGGKTDDQGLAAVEMGRKSSYGPVSDKDSDKPFTFNGTIYIKGNLDIVGDVDINGTIYVDGNVVIREIENVGEDNNLVILSSGTIHLTDRYTDEEDLDVPGTLSAFLYSESAMEIYSVKSHNRIRGGIATGHSDSYIELNTLRFTDDDELPTRMSISFDRGIFERETPGLPAGDRFHIDIYDRTYPEVGEVSISE